MPPRGQPRRVVGHRFAAGFGFVLLAGTLVAIPPVCAEPIALGPSDAEARAALTEDPFSAHAETPLDTRSDETAIAVATPPAMTSATTEAGDAPRPAAPHQPAAALEARAPQPNAGFGRLTKDAGADGVVRRHASSLAVAESEPADGETDWEREIKDAIRPIYDDLAARGVIDAVQGFRSYLAMLGVLLSRDAAPPAGDRTRVGGVAETRVGGADPGWDTPTGRTDALMPGKSEAQLERERLIAAIIVKEWIAAVLPWIYALAALVVAWQIAKVTFKRVASRPTRTQRRAAKSQRRSVDSARTRARS